MAATAGNAVYSNIFKKKMADVLRIGTGGGLCFCGINLYFKNEKFYNDWVFPIVNRLHPEMANRLALKATEYEFLHSKISNESNSIAISNQPISNDEIQSEVIDSFKVQTNSQSQCIHNEVSNDNTSGCADLDSEDTIEDQFINFDDNFSDSSSINDFGGTQFRSNGTGCAFKICDSPRRELDSTAPDSPSLSTRVNIDSPLRSSNTSLIESVQDQCNANEIIPNKESIMKMSNISMDDMIPSLSTTSDENVIDSISPEEALTVYCNCPDNDHDSSSIYTKSLLCESYDCNCKGKYNLREFKRFGSSSTLTHTPEMPNWTTTPLNFNQKHQSVSSTNNSRLHLNPMDNACSDIYTDKDLSSSYSYSRIDKDSELEHRYALMKQSDCCNHSTLTVQLSNKPSSIDLLG